MDHQDPPDGAGISVHAQLPQAPRDLLDDACSLGAVLLVGCLALPMGRSCPRWSVAMRCSLMPGGPSVLYKLSSCSTNQMHAGL